MPPADRAAPPVVFAELLADASRSAGDEAHAAARDLLAPLVADVERAMRRQGLTPFRRAEAAAYRATVEAGRRRPVDSQRLDTRF